VTVSFGGGFGFAILSFALRTSLVIRTPGSAVQPLLVRNADLGRFSNASSCSSYSCHEEFAVARKDSYFAWPSAIEYLRKNRGSHAVGIVSMTPWMSQGTFSSFPSIAFTALSTVASLSLA
jgi:hypothetical protein